jgi:outer membrane immunogenic protein
MQASKLTRSASVLVSAILCISVASAADLPVRPYAVAPAPMPVVARVIDWSGFYVGVELGAQVTDNAWRTTSVFLPPGIPAFANAAANFDQTAFRGGGYAGYDYQFHPYWLVGIEGDIAGMAPSQRTLIGIPGTISTPGFLGALAAGNPDRVSSRVDWDASIRGRLGFLPVPNVLLYGTGGVAFADVNYTTSCGLPAFPAGSWCSFAPKSESHNSVRTGWTAGGGIEAFIVPRWIIRGEYRYSEYDSQNHVFFANAPTDTVSATTKLRTHNVMLGFSYKFSPWGVARYTP